MSEFVVKRMSISGGMEYVVEGKHMKYRWDKKAIEHVFRTTDKRLAQRVARSQGGTVTPYMW